MNVLTMIMFILTSLVPGVAVTAASWLVGWSLSTTPRTILVTPLRRWGAWICACLTAFTTTGMILTSSNRIIPAAVAIAAIITANRAAYILGVAHRERILGR